MSALGPSLGQLRPTLRSISCGPPDDADGDHRRSAATIVGLLADSDRRRVLAAIELGATTLHQVTTATALADQRSAKALARLVEGGIVTTTPDGGFAVAGDVFTEAARAALQRPPSTEHSAETPDVRRVLDAFVRDGCVVSMPTAPSKRRVVLDFLARRFEPGRRYTETEVNEMLAGHTADPATLRRFLVDATFLGRADGRYWRTGGTFDPGS